MTQNVETMNKEQLRAACKAAGIAYGKLNNDGMRAALLAKQNEAGTAEDANEESGDEDSDDSEEGDDEGQDTEVKPQPAPAAQNSEPAPGPRAKTTGTVVEPKSLKIEKGREERNGVKRPSLGSICREVWDALDAKRTELGEVPSFENVRDLMKTHNWQRNTAFTQFQRWKQFNGVMPRTEGEADAE